MAQLTENRIGPEPWEDDDEDWDWLQRIRNYATERGREEEILFEYGYLNWWPKRDFHYP
jgi:hypothetical protein